MSVLTRQAPSPAGGHGPPRPRVQHKTRRRLGGVAFLVVMALLVWLSVLLYQQQFTPVSLVTLYTSSVGNEMHPGAQVMVRGVQVGSVRSISATGTGARLELAIQPSMVSKLPANVTAEMLPTTLFGERYVDLILPARPSARTLAAGSVIRQDRSHDALELEKVLNNLLPMLRSVEPEKLSLTLTALAQGLNGRGAQFGHGLVALSTYLRHTNPQLPQLDTDITRLAGLARTYNQAAPSILAALNDFGASAKIVSIEESNYAALLANFTAAANDLHGFLNANSANSISLSADSIPSLTILARYAPEFPCVLTQLANFVPAANRALGQGTRQPGLHVTVTVVPEYASARYRPGKDTPRYGDNLGPHCYRVPFPGIHLNDGTSGQTGASTAPAAAPAAGAASPGTGPAAAGRASTRAMTAPPAPGSPAEGELARELAALALGRRPAALPSWSGLLVAPLYRGTQVRLGVGRA